MTIVISKEGNKNENNRGPNECDALILGWESAASRSRVRVCVYTRSNKESRPSVLHYLICGRGRGGALLSLATTSEGNEEACKVKRCKLLCVVTSVGSRSRASQDQWARRAPTKQPRVLFISPSDSSEPIPQAIKLTHIRVYSLAHSPRETFTRSGLGSRFQIQRH